MDDDSIESMKPMGKMPLTRLGESCIKTKQLDNVSNMTTLKQIETICKCIILAQKTFNRNQPLMECQH